MKYRKIVKVHQPPWDDGSKKGAGTSIHHCPLYGPIRRFLLLGV
jgi:hypothetical protein